jgi:hypothetical protein
MILCMVSLRSMLFFVCSLADDVNVVDPASDDDLSPNENSPTVRTTAPVAPVGSSSFANDEARLSRALGSAMLQEVSPPPSPPDPEIPHHGSPLITPPRRSRLEFPTPPHPHDLPGLPELPSTSEEGVTIGIGCTGRSGPVGVGRRTTVRLRLWSTLPHCGPDLAPHVLLQLVYRGVQGCTGRPGPVGVGRRTTVRLRLWSTLPHCGPDLAPHAALLQSVYRGVQGCTGRPGPVGVGRRTTV